MAQLYFPFGVCFGLFFRGEVLNFRVKGWGMIGAQLLVFRGANIENYKAHRIHGTGIFTYIYHIQIN